ncbi:MAG: hypothetical protein ACRDN0_13355, partial [Trebonia sp.]
MSSDGEAGTDEQVTAPDEEVAVSEEQATAADERTAVPDEPAAVPDEEAAAPTSAQSRPRGIRALPRRASRRAGRIRPRWRVVSMTVLVLLVAGVAVWDGLLTSQQNRTQDTRNAENAAMSAAKADIEQILS